MVLVEQLVDITGVEVTGEYRLRLTFADGTVGDVDFAGRAWGGVFEPLRDPDYFARVTVDPEAELLTHPMILRAIWGPAFQEESNYLHVHVSHLRRKIEPDPARPRYLLNQAGVGYRLVDPADRSS
jgi:hypothetical protein